MSHVSFAPSLTPCLAPRLPVSYPLADSERVVAYGCSPPRRRALIQIHIAVQSYSAPANVNASITEYSYHVVLAQPIWHSIPECSISYHATRCMLSFVFFWLKHHLHDVSALHHPGTPAPCSSGSTRTGTGPRPTSCARTG